MNLDRYLDPDLGIRMMGIRFAVKIHDDKNVNPWSSVLDLLEGLTNKWIRFRAPTMIEIRILRGIRIRLYQKQNDAQHIPNSRFYYSLLWYSSINNGTYIN